MSACNCRLRTSAGVARFCVAGASTALDFPPIQAVALGATTGIRVTALEAG